MSVESLRGEDDLKVHFRIKKKVDFGQALYIVGNLPQFGSWTIQTAFRLTWNSDDYWSGSARIVSNQSKTIEFKYVIGLWQHPQSGFLEWQAGKQNRKIERNNTKNHIICQNKWNMERITLNLLVPEEDFFGEDYYVIGNCKELGQWKKTNKMNPIFPNINLPTTFMKDKNISDRKLFTVSFEVYRGKKKIHYYYMKKSDKVVVERQPGRKVELSGKSFHSRCLKIQHQSGEMEIYQECYFNELNYSKITDKIFLGSYLHTSEDFELLKREGIDAILSIQTQKDYKSHSLSPHYLQLMAREYGINLSIYSIEDMNAQDFYRKAKGALNILKKLKKQNKKVYVHCSAGMYRSPQIVILHLVLQEKYTLEEAIKTVTQRHAFANPNVKIVDSVLKNVKQENKQNSFTKIINLN